MGLVYWLMLVLCMFIGASTVGPMWLWFSVGSPVLLILGLAVVGALRDN